MAKKSKPGSPPRTEEAAGLKHNPFAALAAKLPAAAAAEPTAASAAPPPAPAASPASVDFKTGPAPTVAAQPASKPAAAPEKPGKSRGRLVLRRETKHRGGKAVVIVRGFAQLRDFDDSKVTELAKELKQKLGCGGTVEHGEGETEIVLQGDRAAKVAELLRAQGFRVDGVTS